MARLGASTRSRSVGWLVSVALVGCVPELDYLSSEPDSTPSVPATAGATAAEANVDSTSYGGVGGGVLISGGNGGNGGNGGATAGAAGTTPNVASGGATGGTSPAQAGNAGAPSAGSAANEVACEPTGGEVCDGADNDCNEVVDDGCPQAATTTFEADLRLIGGSLGGSPFSDDCDRDQVLTGVQVAMGQFLSRVQGVCSKLRVALSSDSTAYELIIEEGASLPSHPEATADVTSVLNCPAGEVLVGLGVSQQYLASTNGTFVIIPEVWPSCAKLSLVWSGSDYYVDWQDAHDLDSVVGSLSDDTAWYEYSEVPSAQLGTRLNGAAGAWIDRLGFGVSTIAVTLVP